MVRLFAVYREIAHCLLRYNKRRTNPGAGLTFAKNLAIKAPNLHAPCDSLSGGNQQKVVISKWLMSKPKVLIMDDPTRGIDVGAKEEIFDIMTELAQRGLGVLFVSTELKEVMAMADRILVMSKGRITAEMTRQEATEQRLVEASAIGHDINLTTVKGIAS